ncbi:MAG: hypothetical protein IT162_23085 [Bryobacterales bacterium]|nr:hypothetical protein [Bryobacterales bacterium]
METRLPECLVDRARRAPLDVFDLAVRLETDGVTDEVARADYGFASTLDMASAVLPEMPPPAPLAPEPAESVVRAWFRGTAFAIPMLLCAFALMSLRVSLWGGDLSSDAASAVAIATVASLVTTGGFVQAMARRGLFHIGTRNFGLAASLTLWWTRVAVVSLVAAAAGALLANAVFSWMPAGLAVWSAGFFVLLGIYWLACGGLYVVGRGGLIAGSTVAGIAIVAVLHLGLGVALLAAQIAGLVAASAVAVAGVVQFFHARGVQPKDLRRTGSSPSRELYLTGFNFLYGAAYYVFMFTDRMIAWTAQTGTASLPIQFRGDYETALDLAMAALVPQAGFVQASLVSFHREVKRVQQQLPAGHYRQFNEKLREFYWQRLALLAGCGVVAGLVVLALVTRWELLPFAAMQPVLWLALLAFPIAVAGLWNASLLFTLSQPAPVAAAVLIGAVCSAVPGYVVTRLHGYDAAAIGFLTGAVAFAAASAASVLSRLRALDHHYYESAV